MSLTAIAIRALFAYAFLLALARASGKRTLRQLTPIDFTASIIMSDLIDDLLWAEVPAAQFVVAAGTLALTAVLVTVGVRRSRGFARWVEGEPVELVRSGRLVPEAARRVRVGTAQLAQILRGAGVEDPREIRSLRMETHGAAGLLREEWAEEAEARDRPRLRELQGERP